MMRLSFFITIWLGAFCALPAMAERTFGLVIGIDEYTFVPDLHGAVNDAEDIADALETLGADVTLLTNGQATRSAILNSWEAILVKADDGDRLIVSYAGHGSNEPESLPGSEEDGRDENFLLAGYAPRGEAASQRIRDDEIASLLARSAALDVIFVADACHAGTVTRDLNPVLGYRYVTPGNMSADPLPPPPPPPMAGETPDQVALFLAAVNETEKVPEVLIDGTPRGALSYAFANGLRGAADVNQDGVLTKGELETHVRRTVRQVTDGVQLPQSEPAGQENRSLIRLPAGSQSPKISTLTHLPFAQLPKLSVDQAWFGVSGVDTASPPTLRLQGPTVLSAMGDRVAVAADVGTLQAVADKHRLVRALDQMAHHALTVTFDRGDQLYTSNQQLAIQIDARQTPYLTLFNLAADGTITLLYPVPALQDPTSIAPHDRINLPVGVSAPFGADHVVAIETDRPALALRQGLARLDGSRKVSELWDLIRQSGGRLALFPFFTAEAAL